MNDDWADPVLQLQETLSAEALMQACFQRHQPMQGTNRQLAERLHAAGYSVGAILRGH